jgi:hypothetical protein
MAKGRPLTLVQWVDRLLRRNADIVRKSRGSLPAYVGIESLGAELWGRGHLLIMTKTQIVVLKDAQIVFAS